MQERESNIYIYPTDTVWGIGANIHSEEAQTLIAQIKQSALNKPLTVLFTSVSQLNFYLQLSSNLQEQILMMADWEITFGVSCSLIKEERIADYIYKESDKIFFRFLPWLEKFFSFPVTTTSANLSGEPPVRSLQELDSFIIHAKTVAPQIRIVGESIEGSGQSSTIIVLDKQQWIILREGYFATKIKQHLEL